MSSVLLLRLVAIVKDEMASIRRVLASAEDAADAFSILDTGSMDGTQKAICSYRSAGRMGDLTAPVLAPVRSALREEPFQPFILPGAARSIIDFAATRNRALDLAEADGAVFTLMLSGDETLEGGEALRAFLEAHRGASEGAYAVELRSGTQRWFYPRVLRVGGGWRYEEPIHEIPVGPGGKTSGPVISGVHIRHAASDPTRRFRRMREVDLPVLCYLAEDEGRSLEKRAPAIFNLAQTYEALADERPRTADGPYLFYKMAAMAAWWRYREVSRLLGGDRTKANFAEFRYYNIAEQIGLYDSEELVRRLDSLASGEPNIPEIHYLRAVHAAQVDARQGLRCAEHAAEVARTARLTHLPLDPRVEWLSLRIAAGCARELKLERAREIAERGVAAGGPREAFQAYL